MKANSLRAGNALPAVDTELETYAAFVILIKTKIQQI
jgi:hypothetical protein